MVYEIPFKPIPLPVGEIRFYGGKYKVRILSDEDYDTCRMPYSNVFGLYRSETYPCLVFEDFTTGNTRLTFKAGDRVLLKKKFLHKSHRDTWGNSSISRKS